MTVTVKYDKRDFWGQWEYREDVKEDATYDDIKKAISYMKKHPSVAIQISNDYRSVVFMPHNTTEKFASKSLVDARYYINSNREIDSNTVTMSFIIEHIKYAFNIS